MKASSKIVYITLAVLLLCLVTLYIFSGGNGRAVTSENYYEFEPESLLKTLANGNDTVFSPVDSDTVGNETYSYGLVSWTQSDYLYIASAVHQLVWHESVESWAIGSLHFNLACSKIDKGFQYAIFTYMKEKISIRGYSAVEHEIHIEPQQGLISAWEFIYDPGLVRSKSVDMKDISITADQALIIAEENGGSEIRAKNNNSCDTSASLSPNSVNYDGWRVMYSPQLFSISIDPTTGEEVK